MSKFNKEKIKELYPGAEELMIEPMLIHSATDNKIKEICFSEEYFGQIKKDGALYQFVKVPQDCYLFGRTVSKKTGLLTEKSHNIPHIKKALSCLPDNTIILGEIYYPGKTSKDVTTIMGCLPEKAIERQNGSYGKIHYYIYDILYYDGINLINTTPNLLRYKILEKIFYKHGLQHYDFLELSEIYFDNLYNKLSEVLYSGEEGMVFKKRNAFYEPGKRPMTNYKAKKVDYIDAVIIGFESPTIEYYGKDLTNWEYWINPCTGEKYPLGLYNEKAKADEKNYLPVTKAYYKNWINSRIKIGAYDNGGNLISIGTISSGISDILKEAMSTDPDFYLNKVCYIQCMELDKKEKTLRHGFLIGVRDDKNPKECLLETIFDL